MDWCICGPTCRALKTRRRSGLIFFFFKKIKYRCFYLHRSRDSVSVLWSAVGLTILSSGFYYLAQDYRYLYFAMSWVSLNFTLSIPELYSLYHLYFPLVMVVSVICSVVVTLTIVLNGCPCILLCDW